MRDVISYYRTLRNATKGGTAMSFDEVKFAELLNENHTFPCLYTFKFIVKASHKERLLNHLTDHKIQEKISKKGNYCSITSELHVESSDHVLEIYKRIGKVEGVMTL